MKLASLPPNVRAVIAGALEQYEVSERRFDRPYRERTAPEQAARDLAIARLANELLDGKPRYSLTEISRWFGCTRATVEFARRRSGLFQSRRPYRAA